jgi:hypothetical protein
MWTVYQNTKKASDATVEFQRLQGLKPVMTTPMTPEQVAGRTYRGLIGEVPRTPTRVDVPAKPGSTTVNVNINRAQVNANDVVRVINDKLKNQGSALRIQ